MGVQLEMQCARQPVPSGPQPGNVVKDVVLLVNLELGIEISEIRGPQVGFSQSCILPNMSEINFHCTINHPHPISQCPLSLKAAPLCLPLVTSNSIVTSSEKSWYGSDPPPGGSIAPDRALA